MFRILWHYGIPEQITDAICLLYKGSYSAVIINGMKTDEFKVTTGTLQGEALVPYIFIVVIDWVMRNPNIDDFGFTRHKCQSSRILEKRISDLEYTCNNGFIENEKDKTQVQPDALSSVAKEGGLVINEDKKKSCQKTLNQNLKSNLMKQCLEWWMTSSTWEHG